MLDRYVIRALLETEVTCLPCGWLAPPSIERMSGVARSDQARAARSARISDEKALELIDRVAGYVAR